MKSQFVWIALFLFTLSAAPLYAAGTLNDCNQVLKCTADPNNTNRAPAPLPGLQATNVSVSGCTVTVSSPGRLATAVPLVPVKPDQDFTLYDGVQGGRVVLTARLSAARELGRINLGNNLTFTCTR